MARSPVQRITDRTTAAAKAVGVAVTRRASSDEPEQVTAAAEKTTPAKKPASTNAPAKKAASTKAVAKKAAKKAATKPPATKAPATKAAATKPPATKAPATKASATKAAATKAPAKRPSANPERAKPTSPPSGELVVKPDEDPWTSKELEQVRAELVADATRLRGELAAADEELAGLMRDAGDGAGNDQADMGSTTFERDQEISLVNNARDMLAQTERALGRMDDGTYGVCENCGEPIGKMRVMAFPRATLCLPCKQREERR